MKMKIKDEIILELNREDPCLLEYPIEKENELEDIRRRVQWILPLNLTLIWNAVYIDWIPCIQDPFLDVILD